MKIRDFYKPVINEGGFVEPNLMMSIQNVVKRGYADNNFEFMVLARLLQLLKLGEFYKNSNPLFDGNISTSKEILDQLRSLPHNEISAIATKLLSLLHIKDEDLLYSYANPTQEYLEWIHLLTSREAND